MLNNNSSFILIQNPYQNAVQSAPSDGCSNYLSYCGNAPITAEVFNTKIGSSFDVTHRGHIYSEIEGDEPLFGTHIREAAATLRKVFAPR